MASAADEFFSSPAWDDKAAAELDMRMRRVPKKSRLKRYSNKAWALFYKSDNDPVRQRAAITLIERGVDEDGVDADQAAFELVTAAGYAATVGDRARAIALARRSIAFTPRPLHVGRVSAHELIARCLTDGGEPGARAAWEAYYLRREMRTEGRWQLPAYDDLAGREAVDASGAPVHDPDDAAEGIVVIYHASEPPEPAVPGIMKGDIASLDALDRHYRATKPSCERKWAPRAVFKEDYLLGTHLPQLGAYVGRVLVGTAGGRWRVEAPLMRSRVVVGKKAIDPFRAAYDAIYFEASLADFARSVTKG